MKRSPAFVTEMSGAKLDIGNPKKPAHERHTGHSDAKAPVAGERWVWGKETPIVVVAVVSGVVYFTDGGGKCGHALYDWHNVAAREES